MFFVTRFASASVSEKVIEMESGSRSMSAVSATLSATWENVTWSLRVIWHATGIETWIATLSVSCSLLSPFFRHRCVSSYCATANWEARVV